VSRSHWGWVAGGYLVGTIPSALVAARITGSKSAMEGADPTTSAGDAHLLLAEDAGPMVSALAMFADFAKAALVAAAAERAGLEPGWRAAASLATVAGHAFPFHSRRHAGRGLAAAAGVTMVNLPGPMVVAGSVLLAGKALGHTGAGSTLGFAAVPVLAQAQRRPKAFVAMGCGVLGLILARRLQGSGRAPAPHGRARAVARRLLFDEDIAQGEPDLGVRCAR
jgi:glycerol-3-phosphate acyltransferase PlsY